MTAALDLRPLFPAFFVAFTGVIVLLAVAFTPKGSRAPAAGLSLAGLVGALVAVIVIARGPGRGSVLAQSLAADDFALFFEALILAIGIVAVLLSPSYLRETAMDRGEYYALMLFAIVGMMGLVSALELVAVFVALEIMSVAVYALAGLQRDREESQEAALKYFITGSFSSAFLLYGIAVLYGLTGTTSLALIAARLHAGAASPAMPGAPATALALVGVGLLLVGFGFKVASVPFHMWAPDAYEGAPTTVTALMAAGVKAAAFGAFLRVFVQALPSLAAQWQPAVAVLALVTMVVGNLAALAQTNLKRMLAYSSVAHAGYLLTAVVAAPGVGTEAVLFYLVAYAAVNLGGFGAFAALTRAGREPLSLTDMAGLSARRPLLAAALTVFLVSLTGVPISGGFVGKFYLFSAAVSAGYTHLAVVGMLMSAVSAYYYLRVVVAMYMQEPAGEDGWSRVTPGAGLALALATAVVLVLGVYPGPLMDAARAAARSLQIL
jgi:NADH-quinone oxidoreductase subunit N